MKPTEEMVALEINKLTTMKPNVRKKSAFGDNNHEAIEAQIQVLERDMDDDGIHHSYYRDNEDRHTLDAALSARSWLDGDGENDTLSEEWESLVQR